jgi:hypothetical protein
MHPKSPIDSLESGARTQRERFIETARSLECDEDEATFKAKLAVIARQKPKAADAPKPKDWAGGN